MNEASLNDSSARTPELLARHCDLLLKKGKAVLDDKQLEDKLNQIVRAHWFICFASDFACVAFHITAASAGPLA